MYKNKVFRAILSWAWSCPYFRERGLGWPRRLNPKAIPAPRFSHLPAIAHSFLLAYSYGRNCEQNYAEAFVFCFFFLQLPANQTSSKPTDCISPNYHAQPPAPIPSGQQHPLTTLALGSVHTPAIHSPRHHMWTGKENEVTWVWMAQVPHTGRVLMSN